MSILSDTKSFLGLSSDQESFDIEILMFINSAISDLSELHDQTSPTYFNVTKDTEWNEYLKEEHQTLLALIQEYIYTYTRVAFDPPANSFSIAAIERRLERVGFRITSVNSHTNQEVIT